MKRSFKTLVPILVFTIIMLSHCVTYKKKFYIGNGDIEQARMNIIIDFAKKNDAIVLTNNIKDFKNKGITTIEVAESLKPVSQIPTVISKLNNLSDQASKNCDLINCALNLKLRDF